MRSSFAAGACLLAVVACTPAQEARINTALATPAGQLYCAVRAAGGSAVVVGLVNAAVAGAAPSAAPLAVIATGATKAFVDAACARAGGVPVVPPVDPAAAPQVAIVPPSV